MEMRIHEEFECMVNILDEIHFLDTSFVTKLSALGNLTLSIIPRPIQAPPYLK